MGAARSGQLSSPCGVAGPSCCLRAPGHASLATPASSLLPPCCSWHPASNPFLTSFQPYTPLGPRCPEGSAVAQVRMWPSGLGGGGGCRGHLPSARGPTSVSFCLRARRSCCRCLSPSPQRRLCPPHCPLPPFSDHCALLSCPAGVPWYLCPGLSPGWVSPQQVGVF